MRRYGIRLLGAVLTLLLACGVVSPSRAATGEVSVVFTKGGFVVGAGSGHGVLVFRGHRYPFDVSGLSVGFTIGASTTRLVGRALNLRTPDEFAGHYGLIGAGGALAGGVGGVRLRNQRGVILDLAGGKFGVELSVAVGGIAVELR